MPESEVVLAIDTSNYTTSAAIMGVDGELLANIKRPLPVKDGECGLRQSDAVFAHIKNLPSAMEEAKGILKDKKVVAVGVSRRPRNVEESYMPCFLTGVAEACGISAALSVPMYTFSHQCGHIMAAIYSSHREDVTQKPFCAFHVSGGTTEVLHVQSLTNTGFSADIVGGGADLHAGQVIDRVGVYMGVPFPCGPAMEQLALTYRGRIPYKKICVQGMYANLSGLENMAKKLFDETQDPALTSAFVFHFVGESLAAMSQAYADTYGLMPFVYAGGVMCNSIIKDILRSQFDASFAEPRLSADNAVGIAVLTVRSYRKEKSGGSFVTP